MKVIKADLDKTIKDLTIVPLADLHLGDPNCNTAKIKEYIERIKKDSSTYCVLNGDLINNATKSSVSDVYSEELTPMAQLQLARDLLYPIKDKILCITNGNHEFRSWRMDGIDLLLILARELGIEEKYSPTSAVIFLKFGAGKKDTYKSENSHANSSLGHYTIYVNHGSGGGRKEGAKAIRLADMASIIDADVYIHSHTHLPMILKEKYFRTNITTRTITQVDKLFVNTSAMLDFGGYGENYEFKPSSTDTPIIYLSGQERKMEAKL